MMLKTGVLSSFLYFCVLGLDTDINGNSYIEWLPAFQKRGSSSLGYLLLGSYCFGYSTESDVIVGQVDLRIELPANASVSDAFDDMQILLLDSEPGSYDAFAALPAAATCTQRKQLAKNFRELDADFTVQFNPIEQNGHFQWLMTPPMQLKDSAAPRQWYLVGIRCDSTNNTYTPIPNIVYDLRFTGGGLYFQDTGPTQCIVGNNADQSEQDGVIAGIVTFVIIDVILVLLLCKKFAVLKSGNMKINTRNIDEEVDLDDNMLSSGQDTGPDHKSEMLKATVKRSDD